MAVYTSAENYAIMRWAAAAFTDGEQQAAQRCCVARPMSRLVAAEMARSACAEVVPFCVLWVRGPERSGTHARYRAIGDSS